jgi:hypothetical protein
MVGLKWINYILLLVPLIAFQFNILPGFRRLAFTTKSSISTKSILKMASDVYRDDLRNVAIIGKITLFIQQIPVALD